MRQNLLDLDRLGLEQFFATWGEKPFRARQILQWLHQRGVQDFAAMSDLSKNLRQRLDAETCIGLPEVLTREDAADGTRKWLLKLKDGNAIEMVFIPEDDRGTLCVSSQVGCSLNCQFCATARQGFNRNLDLAEIVGQMFVAFHDLAKYYPNHIRPITNVVFMGMGEPLLNFETVTKACNLFMDDLAYGLGKRKVTISTAGIVPKIIELHEHTDVSLALSLHAATDSLRDQLVPLNRKYPLAEVINACQTFVSHAPRKRITIEYVMLQGINDRIEDAEALITLLQDLPHKLNLIPFNPFPDAGFSRSSNNRIHAFQDHLVKAGFLCTIRKTRGDDIAAACGQLVGQFADRTTRQVRWHQLHATR